MEEVTQMKITVSGQNIDAGSAFQQHGHDIVTAMIEKYYATAISAHITLEKQTSSFQVKIRMSLTNRITLESTGYAHDAHLALEAAATHAEKRLRRHKRRLKNHRQNSHRDGDAIMHAPMGIYATAEQVWDKTQEAKTDIDDNETGDNLPLIAELSYEVENLTVEQAVMRLELTGETCLLFRHAGHMGLNMVYFRKDGTIGWVDPRGTRQMAHTPSTK